MIPKIIHYCWFGNKEQPDMIKLCIDSFYKFHSDWEIKFWNEDNFDQNDYVKFCLKQKYWVKITDYLRLKVLHEFGGIYLDADAEIIKPIDDLLDNTIFFGYESARLVNHAISGSIPNHPYMKKLHDIFLTKFDGRHNNVKGGPGFITEMLKHDYNIEYNDEITKYDDITLYPTRYFFPYYYLDKFTPECITPDTYIVHRWANTWIPNTKYYNIK